MSSGAVPPAVVAASCADSTFAATMMLSVEVAEAGVERGRVGDLNFECRGARSVRRARDLTSRAERHARREAAADHKPAVRRGAPDGGQLLIVVCPSLAPASDVVATLSAWNELITISNDSVTVAGCVSESVTPMVNSYVPVASGVP